MNGRLSADNRPIFLGMNERKNLLADQFLLLSSRFTKGTQLSVECEETKGTGANFYSQKSRLLKPFFADKIIFRK